MSILIKTVRISGFRGLENIEVSLEKTTILTGMNNTGKTSFLKSLQLALGNTQFVSKDDFFIGESNAEKIVIDLLIVPIDNEGERSENFSNDWENLFTVNRIRYDDSSNAFVPLRTIITLDENSHQSEKFILQIWPDFKQKDRNWFDIDNGKKISFPFYRQVPFFYVDAQRDILEDTKYKNSYLGKMLSEIEYSQEDTDEIEKQIKSLNAKVVENSSILFDIKTTLEELNTAMDDNSEGIEITPLTKKLRDLNKGLQIYYTDRQESFSMEYHGMGTRSWSSLLTLKAFISSRVLNAKTNQRQCFPIIAIEEPEAHLHPNAQKKLYKQINSMSGQKVIATHSPYIAASAKLGQIRNFYKDDTVICGKINTKDLTPEGIRKIKRQIAATRGEVFFSKIIVLFEGETEEQALPIFAQKYFGKPPIELGIDFVGVGGYGNYLHFIRFAESLKIPWLIFSDGERSVKEHIQKALKKVLNKPEVNLENETNIFIIDNENNFEGYLIDCEYIEEIKLAFANLHDASYLEDQIKKKDGTKKDRIKTKEICEKCQQNIYEDVLRDYNGDDGFKEALYDCMTSQKTQFGPVIAEQIIKSDKPLPPKVIKLFDQLNTILDAHEVEI